MLALYEMRASLAETVSNSAALSDTFSGEIELDYFIDPKFLGDKNHAIGIIDAIKSQAAIHKMTIKALEWDVNNYSEYKEMLPKKLTDSNQTSSIKHVVIGIGTHGLKLLETLTASPELRNRLYTVWSGHQYIAGLDKLAGKINLLALPQHILTGPVKKQLHHPDTKLLAMVGVPHNVSQTTVVESLKKWQSDHSLPKIPEVKQYIGVILGGDAPDEHGKQKYFTPEEARVYAAYIANQALKSGATVLVTNGPRTGKFNPKTAEECKVHQEGSEIDSTSKAFIDVLIEKSIPHKLYNFTFGKPSAYQPILATIATNVGTAYVTGDSTSMVSEMLDILSKDRFCIVQVGSQNTSHNAHIESVSKSCLVRVFNIDVEHSTLTQKSLSTSNTEIVPATTYVPAATEIANGILMEISKVNLQKLKAG